MYAHGLAVFDDDKGEFAKLADWDMKAPAFPSGQCFRRTEDGVDYVYFGNPYPLTRVRADPAHFRNPADYETYTCLNDGSRLDDPALDRDADGRLRYAWRKDSPVVGPAEQAKLVAGGKMKAKEGLLQLRDRDTDKAIFAHAGSVYWNDYRRRWVMIAVQSGGSSSFLGEIWYAEADTPVGPWVYAVKVATHDRYSFYNPKQDPMFDKDGGRVIFFEGTYTQTFSGNPDPTPRYDYNQILYKLDLSDPRLAPPTPVYDVAAGEAPQVFSSARPVNEKSPHIAFYAPDRPFRGGMAVLLGKDGLHVGGPAEKGAVFYALPSDAKNPAAGARPLYEYRHRDGDRRAYSVEADMAPPGYVRAEKPLCLVWRLPGQLDEPRP